MKIHRLRILPSPLRVGPARGHGVPRRASAEALRKGLYPFLCSVLAALCSSHHQASRPATAARSSRPRCPARSWAWRSQWGRR